VRHTGNTHLQTRCRVPENSTRKFQEYSDCDFRGRGYTASVKAVLNVNPFRIRKDSSISYQNSGSLISLFIFFQIVSSSMTRSGLVSARFVASEMSLERS